MRDIEETKKLTKEGWWEEGFYCIKCKTYTFKYFYFKNDVLTMRCEVCQRERPVYYENNGKDPFGIEKHIHDRIGNKINSQGELNEPEQTQP